MKKVSILLVMFISLIPNIPPAFGNNTIDGIYEGSEFSLSIHDGKLFPLINGKEVNEQACDFYIKNNLLYVEPYVPKGEHMIRNVVVVYKITQQGLTSSHIEDVDTGEKFYQDSPEISLIKTN